MSPSTSSGQSKLVLIDGNAILHRAYHALPPLTTKKKEPINAVYGFISMFLKLVQDLQPTHVAVCFDRKEPTFRHEEFEAYQAHRPEMDKDLSVQFEKARDVISAFGIPIYDKAGFEADDVIGTLAFQAVVSRAEKRGRKTRKSAEEIDEVVIVTGDRDILQLVTDKIKVYLPIRGLSEAQLMGKKEVVEKLGVKPNQVDDFKALVGDPSDNYKGVPGIGPKTAIKLLNKYNSIDNVYRHLDEIEERVQQKLKAHRKDVTLYQKLAKIVTDVKLDVDLNKMSKWKVDSQEILNLFAEYGFKTLTKRVKDVGSQIVSKNQGSLF